MVAGSQMWNSEVFTEDQILSWENKPAIDQTWPNLQTYFTEKWLEQKQYSVMMAKQSRFKKAALLARETAATKEEGETQAMLFAMLQEQHEKQMATMAASNKANMVAMMERMNALVTAGGGRLGWEIHSEFRGILQFFQFWTFWILEFSLEFYFSDCKMCSRQF